MLDSKIPEDHSHMRKFSYIIASNNSTEKSVSDLYWEHTLTQPPADLGYTTLQI